MNREVKQRSDVIGIFPNKSAIIRLVGVLMREANDERTNAKRSMSLENRRPRQRRSQRQAACSGRLIKS